MADDTRNDGEIEVVRNDVLTEKTLARLKEIATGQAPALTEPSTAEAPSAGALAGEAKPAGDASAE